MTLFFAVRAPSVESAGVLTIAASCLVPVLFGFYHEYGITRLKRIEQAYRRRLVDDIRISHICRKLGVRSRVELMRRVLEGQFTGKLIITTTADGVLVSSRNGGG